MKKEDLLKQEKNMKKNLLELDLIKARYNNNIEIDGACWQSFNNEIDRQIKQCKRRLEVVKAVLKQLK